MNISSCYPIGYISKTHGLKGEVTVTTHPEFVAEAVEDIESVFVEQNGRLVPYFIESISVQGSKAFLKLEDVSTIEQASALKNHTLYLPKSTRPKLKKGEFYNDEIIGFKVEDSEQGLLGFVTEVEQTGLNRLIQLKNDAGKEFLIPANGPFIKAINKTQKSIMVELPEGFLDI